MPLDVGKQAKRKERARLETLAQELQRDADNEEDDWFSKKGSKSTTQMNGEKNLPRTDQKKKFSFGAFSQGEKRFSKDDGEERPKEKGRGREDLAATSMRDDDSFHIRGAASKVSRDWRVERFGDGYARDRDIDRDRARERARERDREKDRDRWRDRGRDRDRDWDRDPVSWRGPRYRGGYR